jgi:hypothetical protein
VYQTIAEAIVFPKQISTGESLSSQQVVSLTFPIELNMFSRSHRLSFHEPCIPLLSALSQVQVG